MLDARFVYENLDLVRDHITRRNKTIDLTSFVSGFERRRDIIQEVEALKAARNDASKKIGALKKAGQDTAALQDEVRDQGERVKTLDGERTEVEGMIDLFLKNLPNLLHDTVPVGPDETHNVEIRRVGTPRAMTWKPQSHVELGEKLGILDFERAAKLSGARFSVLKGAAARLERALIHFFLDIHTREHGYTEFLTPYLVTRETLTGTGQLPKFEEDVFKTGTADRELFLIPTAEVPLTNLHGGEILDENDLPLLYTAWSPCFRSEAGSYGRDVRGLIRQHQFHKVELVKISHPDQSMDDLEKMVANAERILQLLDLPYRTVALCSGDIGFSAMKTYDIEVWLPGQATYREISSCSNCGDFQARRANIRYRPADGGKGRLPFVHTLNGSGLPAGRTLVAILENYQREDGSVEIPKVLQPYMGGMEVISAGK